MFRLILLGLIAALATTETANSEEEDPITLMGLSLFSPTNPLTVWKSGISDDFTLFVAPGLIRPEPSNVSEIVVNPNSGPLTYELTAGSH